MDRRTFITSTGMSFLGALSGVSDFALAQSPLKI